MLNVRFVCWLKNVFVVSTWLQHRVIVPDKQGVHFPVLEGILSFVTLLFSIRVLPIISFRFLFLPDFYICIYLHVCICLYMTSNMFCVTMMSLVISRLSCFRLAEIRRKESSMKVLFYLLSSWLSRNGDSAFSFWIQNFSHITNISRSASLEPCKFTSFSMMMNLACLLKICPSSWKCFQSRMELGF